MIIVLKTFIVVAIIMFLIKVIYETLGTQMTFLSGNLGTSLIASATIRTVYSMIGMLITQLQIIGQDNKIAIFTAASLGC